MGLPSGASDPPSENAAGSVVGRPRRSRIRPSGIGSRCPAAIPTRCIATVVVATSKTTGEPRWARSPKANGLVPSTALRPPGGATSASKFAHAKPTSPACAASRTYGPATRSCQSRTAAAAIPLRSRARSTHQRSARIGAPGPQPRSPSKSSAPSLSPTTRTRGRRLSLRPSTAQPATRRRPRHDSGGHATQLEGQRRVAPAGSLVKMPKGIPHGYYNTGDEPTRCLFWVTPAGNLKELFDELHEMTDTEEVVAYRPSTMSSSSLPTTAETRNGDGGARARGVGAAVRAFPHAVKPPALPSGRLSTVERRDDRPRLAVVPSNCDSDGHAKSAPSPWSHLGPAPTSGARRSAAIAPQSVVEPAHAGGAGAAVCQLLSRRVSEGAGCFTARAAIPARADSAPSRRIGAQRTE